MPMRSMPIVIVAASLVTAMLVAPLSNAAVDGAVQRYRGIRIDPIQLRGAVDPSKAVTAAATGLSPSDLQQLQQQFHDAFDRELKHAYEMDAKPGPQTLRVQGALIGLDFDRRGLLAPGVDAFETADRLTLVVAVSDSATGEVRERFVLRSGPVANRLQPKTPTFYWERLRKLFRRIALQLRWELEADSEERAS
jgi:hypothetical protein